MWFLIICIIIFLLFVRPAFKVWMAVRRAQKQAQEMNDAFRRAAGFDPEEERRQAAERQQASRRGGWTSPAPRRKKIDPQTGEYVRFKEITVEESETAASPSEASGSQSERVVTEEQIVDVSWVDIDKS